MVDIGAFDKSPTIEGLGQLAQPRSPTQAAATGIRAIELLSEVVTWSALVWFARQERGMTNWVCDGLVIFRGAADGLHRALIGARRTSRCGCSGGPASRQWWISLAK